MHSYYEIISVSDLEESAAAEMYRLFENYYENISFESFLNDLQEKSDIIIIRDENHILRGFSTLMLMNSQIDRENISMVFSGDTIVDIAARSNLSLATAWLEYAFTLKNKIDHPLYWFLISKGYRTYRFLPVFFKEFYPDPFNYNADYKRIVDHFAERKFGSFYNKHSGLISFGECQPKLKQIDDFPGDCRLKDPYISFFVNINPGHVNGDELCCCTPVYIENMKAPGSRILKKIGII